MDQLGRPDTRKPARGGLLEVIYRHPWISINRYLVATQSFEPDRNVPVFKGFSGFVFFGDTPGDTRCSLLGHFFPFFPCLPVMALAARCDVIATLFRGGDRLLTRFIHGVGFHNGGVPVLTGFPRN